MEQKVLFQGGALKLGFDAGTLPVTVDDGGRVMLVDQRKLPEAFELFDATSFKDMLFAIESMVVRGAPSIGVAAAFGLAWESERIATSGSSDFIKDLTARASSLNATRPTAVNLTWATSLLMTIAKDAADQGASPADIAARLKDESSRMLREHIDINRRLSDFGAELLNPKSSVLTHCNAGSLATCGWGTALGVLRSAKLKGLSPSVLVDETRPRQQGARLTMWELKEDEIPSTLVCDSMAGHLMSQGKVDAVIVGADRIALNGDTANKIGTYNLAVLARYHEIPFYVAAPLSTFDRMLSSGCEIPIEFRSESEVLEVDSRSITVDGARAYNPAFDVTPASLITAIITEAGVLRPDYKDSIAAAFKQL